MAKYNKKAPLEANTRTIIEQKLQSLGYCLDERDVENCNVYKERAKFDYQDEALKGKNPDYLIYESGENSSRILAVIEAKRQSESLDKAVDQAISLYAEKLNIPIIFVYNANAFYSCTREKKPLKIDKIEINDFVNEETLKKLIDNDFSIETTPQGVEISREALLKDFKQANKLLRKAGLRDGYERFSVFADLMFLKLKDDFSDIGELPGNNELDRGCSWSKLMQKTPKKIGYDKFRIEDSEVRSYLNDTIKPKLQRAYGDDLFESTLNITDESLLIELIEKIDNIPFQNVDSDVKGDAFEFFLRNVTNGNKDLGEYYTPRHIIKMIIQLVDPEYSEKIYDPCCGTGGFLLEAFKYLLIKANTKIYNSDNLEEQKEKRKKKEEIRQNCIFGTEITSTARTAKMNMILFGDGHSNIKQQDCLLDVITEKYDIVLSNIPYSQEVDNGNLYDFPSKKGDSIFMQHIWKAVKKGGRIAVVVPDTFLYDGDDEKNEIFKIRNKIINESSEIVVISLPRGVFNPYTPTKTSIIYAKKKQSPEVEQKDIYFYVIRNDGYELGARRRPIPNRKSDCSNFFMNYNKDVRYRIEKPPTSKNIIFNDLKRNKSLFPFDYMEHLPKGINNKDEKCLKKIQDYIEEREELFDSNKVTDENADEKCAIISITQNGAYISEILTKAEMSELKQQYKRVYEDDFSYNPHRINIGSIVLIPNLHKNMYVSIIYPVFYLKEEAKQMIPDLYLLKLLKNEEYKNIISDYCRGGARAILKLDDLKRIKILEPTSAEVKKIKESAEKLKELQRCFLEEQFKFFN